MKSMASILAVLIASVTVAQAAPPTPAQSTEVYAPVQQAPTQAVPPGDRSVNTGNGTRPTDANDCSAWVKANNPRLSAAEIKDYCQKDLKPTSPQD
jgi:hypothetical protein